MLVKAFLRVGLFLTPALAICAGWLLFGQSPSTNNQNQNKTGTLIKSETFENWEVENLANLARSAPPEVGADILLSIASTNRTDKERAVALIEEAFRIASQAREPFKQRSVDLQVDTRSGFKEAASNLQVDKTSLQSKAVIKMVPLDRVRARNMFEDISLRPIKTLTCKDALVDDFNPYYQAMEAVANGAFTNKEKKASLPAQFLANRISSIKSISQITPAERVILKANISREGLFLLAQSITEALNRVPDDPRSFAFTIEREPFASTTEQLITKLRQNNVPTTDLIAATRSFLIRNLSGEVCGDARWIKNGVVSMPLALESLNGIFTKPLVVDDIRPAQIGSRADNVVFWSTPKAKRLMDAARTLRFGDGNSPLSEQQRASADWHQKLIEFLDLLENWDSTSESSEDDYFQQRCNMYNLLVELCPEDAQRDVVLRRYATYLKETSGRYKGQMDWILALKDCLRSLESRNETTRKALLDSWLSSSDSSLQLYAKFATLRISGN